MLDYVLIPVGDKFAKVSRCDIDLVAPHKWQNGKGYALLTVSAKIYMHRMIMADQLRPGLCVDHANGDPLDNRRSNLRVCTVAQNAWNATRSKASNATSVYKGVFRSSAQIERWRAQIVVNQKYLNLGAHATPEGAALAYNAAAIKYFGEFARLNVIPAKAA